MHERERPTGWGGVSEFKISLTFREGLYVRLGRSSSGLDRRLHRNGHTHTGFASAHTTQIPNYLFGPSKCEYVSRTLSRWWTSFLRLLEADVVLAWVQRKTVAAALGLLLLLWVY